jgi:zinc transport system substrate-binding protein
MRRLILILACLLCAAPAWAEKLPIAVGIAPMKYFADKIGGDLVETTVMVPAGADAHTYEPKPSQMRAVASARLYFAVGLEFEEAWVPRFQAANPGLKVVRTDARIPKIPMAGRHHHHEEEETKPLESYTVGQPTTAHEEPGDDPHVWTAPPLVKYIAEAMTEALSEADPANARAYRANEGSFLREVDQLDAEIRSALSGLPRNRRTFLAFHPAWGYFAKAYGLTQEAVESEGKEPGPKELANIVAEARKDGIKVVFIQPQFSARTAQTIAEAIGGQVTAADPLAEDWAGNLREVARVFRAALK